jgi:molecular chaperone Hsp33
MADRIIYATIAEEPLRLLAGITTDTVAEVCRRHQTSPPVSIVLGSAVTGALLLGLMQKDEERITVQISCDGPLRGVVAIAESDGGARGYAVAPTASAPLSPEGRPDILALIGGGMMHVTRELAPGSALSRTPYQGSVELAQGGIAESFAYYLTKSEQIPSAVSLGVYVSGDGTIAAAGGFAIQLMPGASDELAEELTRRVARAPTATELVRRGTAPLEMLKIVLGREDLEILEERPVCFRCGCSAEQAAEIIGGLGREDIADLVSRGADQEVVCQVCQQSHVISLKALKEMLRAAEEPRS